MSKPVMAVIAVAALVTASAAIGTADAQQAPQAPSTSAPLAPPTSSSPSSLPPPLPARGLAGAGDKVWFYVPGDTKAVFCSTAADGNAGCKNVPIAR